MTRALGWPSLGLLGILLLAACTAPLSASPGASPSAPPFVSPTASPSAPPSSSPAPSQSPTGNANTALVRIEQTGGMLPLWMTLAYYPSVALYGDGQLIMQGPQIELYPGPALPNLQVTRLTQAGVGQVLAWAREAGLHGPDRELGPLILDSGSTVFTIVHADGAVHRTSVTDLSASDPEIGAVRQFQEVMLSLRAWLAGDVVGDEEPYVFDRLRLIVSEADPAAVDPELASTIDWPLDEPIATLGVSLSEPESYRCALIEGEDLQTLMPLFEGANELTLWESDEMLYQLELRPLLPDEDACPGF